MDSQMELLYNNKTNYNEYNCVFPFNCADFIKFIEVADVARSKAHPIKKQGSLLWYPLNIK